MGQSPDNMNPEGGDAQRRPLCIGVTGGIGAGKSTVIDVARESGAIIFDADAVVHDLYQHDEDVRSAIRGRWGDEVFASDGSLDRRAIASRVFSDEAERLWLEGMVHPLVAQAWLRTLATAKDAKAELVVAEVPLLFEAGLEGRYDVTIAVSAPESLRVERATSRGDDTDSVRARMAAQLTDADREARADHVLRNDGSPEQFRRQVEAVLELLRRPG